MQSTDHAPDRGLFTCRLRAARDTEGVRKIFLDEAEVAYAVRFVRYSFWGAARVTQDPDWEASTFPNDWPRRGPPFPAPLQDELIRRVWSGIIPIDWAEVAAKAGVIRAPIGLTIPVRGIRGTHGMMCVAFDFDREAWAFHRAQRTALATMLAFELHNRLEELFWQERRDMALTTREIECVSLAARGKRSKEIAWALSLGEKTVNFHLSRARLKLRAANTTEAVMRAAEMGLLQAGRTQPAVVA